MTPAEILQAARDLLSDPKRWTQGIFARRENGSTCSTFAPEAFSFCSRGALIKVRPDDAVFQSYAEAYAFLEKCVPEVYVGTEPVAHWNDHPDTTHAEVLAVFDKAIALASV